MTRPGSEPASEWTPSEPSSPRKERSGFPWAAGATLAAALHLGVFGAFLASSLGTPMQAGASARRRRAHPLGRLDPRRAAAGRPRRRRRSPSSRASRSRRRKRRPRPRRRRSCCPAREEKKKKPTPAPASRPARPAHAPRRVSAELGRRARGPAPRRPRPGAGGTARRAAARSSTSRTSSTTTTSRPIQMALYTNWFKPTASRSRRPRASTSASTATAPSPIPRSSGRAGSPSSTATAIRAVLDAHLPAPPARLGRRRTSARPSRSNDATPEEIRNETLRSASPASLAARRRRRPGARRRRRPRSRPPRRRRSRSRSARKAFRRLAVAVPELSAFGIGRAHLRRRRPLHRDAALGRRVLRRLRPGRHGALSRGECATRPYPDAAERWLSGGAEILVDTRAEVSGDKVTIEGRVWDLKSKKMVLGRRYSGGASYVSRIAHTLANDLVKYFTGKDGSYLSTIALRLRPGRATRRSTRWTSTGATSGPLTAHKSLSINPNGRGGRIVYTSYVHTLPADLLDERGRQRQEGDPDRRGPERVALHLARRNPDRLRGIPARATPTFTSSGSTAATSGA